MDCGYTLLTYNGLIKSYNWVGLRFLWLYKINLNNKEILNIYANLLANERCFKKHLMININKIHINSELLMSTQWFYELTSIQQLNLLTIQYSCANVNM